MLADQSRFTINDNNGLSTASAAIYAAKLRPFCIQQTILRVCDITSEQHEQQMRVGVVHALANSLAIAGYGSSLACRSTRRVSPLMMLSVPGGAPWRSRMGATISR